MNHWKKVGKRHHHGINIPLFSIHTKSSCGIGEYTDLIPLIDWISSTGFDVIQLLPLNDSGPDPSPYNALTASGLHPIYLGLNHLPHLTPDLKKRIGEMQGMTKTKRVAYADILEKKENFLRDYYPLFEKDEAFHAFCTHHPQMEGFALFKTLKEAYEGQSCEDWPDELKNLSHHKRKELMRSHKEEIDYHLFVQYLCFQQMSQAKEHAEKKGVFLKGDIPILVSPDSADVWLHPDFFDQTLAAGAPPDQFTPDGQYWGFPLYRWKEIEDHDYSWWKERLHYSSYFYHLYRIDHVIGFFRIWGIERGKSAREGSFIPSSEWNAIAQGRRLLSALLSATSMLPLAEDLGFMPPGASAVLQELGICGTKVFRWEKEDFSDYLPLSLTTVSTHDSETLTLWWQNHSDEAENFAKKQGWNYDKQLSPHQRRSILEQAHKSPSLFHINLLSEYLALFPELVASDPEDERINRPGTIDEANWCYRLIPSVEDLQNHKDLNTFLKSLC